MGGERWSARRPLPWLSWLRAVAVCTQGFRWRARRGRCQEDTEKELRQAGKCSIIMDVRGGGQCEWEIRGVTAAWNCQDPNLTVMIGGISCKGFLPLSFLSIADCRSTTLSHKPQRSSLKSVMNKIVESSKSLRRVLGFWKGQILLVKIFSFTLRQNTKICSNLFFTGTRIFSYFTFTRTVWNTVIEHYPLTFSKSI